MDFNFFLAFKASHRSLNQQNILSFLFREYFSSIIIFACVTGQLIFVPIFSIFYYIIQRNRVNSQNCNKILNWFRQCQWNKKKTLCHPVFLYSKSFETEIFVIILCSNKRSNSHIYKKEQYYDSVYLHFIPVHISKIY